jgi:hypothetical protein
MELLAVSDCAQDCQRDDSRVIPPVPSDRSCLAKIHIQQHKIARSQRVALVDRGANGGVLGCDATVHGRYDNRQIDVTGIDNHDMGGLIMVDAYAKTITQKGPIIVLLNQYANHGVHRTIHSAPQIEANRNLVDDRSMKCGGKNASDSTTVV